MIRGTGKPHSYPTPPPRGSPGGLGPLPRHHEEPPPPLFLREDPRQEARGRFTSPEPQICRGPSPPCRGEGGEELGAAARGSPRTWLRLRGRQWERARPSSSSSSSRWASFPAEPAPLAVPGGLKAKQKESRGTKRLRGVPSLASGLLEAGAGGDAEPKERCCPAPGAPTPLPPQNAPRASPLQTRPASPLPSRTQNPAASRAASSLPHPAPTFWWKSLVDSSRRKLCIFTPFVDTKRIPVPYFYRGTPSGGGETSVSI